MERRNGRVLVIGDIHGAARALTQVLERSKYDPQRDKIIFLGDIADGWSEVPQCVDIILSLPRKIVLCGNHDKWAIDWFKMGQMHPMWQPQGGQATIDAYVKTGLIADSEHREFWINLENNLYHEENDRLFLHGGYDWHYSLDDQPQRYANGYSNLYWDRHMWETALAFETRKRRALKKFPDMTEEEYMAEADIPKFGKQYSEIFVGHTTTTYVKEYHNHTAEWLENPSNPVKALNVWNLDQGAGYEGVLTIMDVDTKEFWQSDPVKELYPDERGRN